MDQNNKPPRVEFETDEIDGYQAVKYYRETNTPKIIQLTMKYSGGLIKKERQAEYVLLGFVVVAVIISLIIILGSGSKIPPPPPTPLQESRV